MESFMDDDILLPWLVQLLPYVAGGIVVLVIVAWVWPMVFKDEVSE